MPASTILVIEGDPTASDSVATLLAGAGYTVTRLPDAEASLATITASAGRGRSRGGYSRFSA